MAELPAARAKDAIPPESETYRHSELPGARARGSQVESYVEKVARYRVFDPSLPEDLVTHLKLELDVLRLRPKDEVGGPRREGDLAKELREKDAIQKLIRRMRRDSEAKAKRWLSPEPEGQDAPHTPESVLHELRDLTITDAHRRELIIQAELLRFGEEQKPELLSVLWNFINACRDSNEVDDLIAVGSTIRKYVANIETANIGSIATLLEPGHAGMPPLDVELEIVKMIYRSFEANPPAKPDAEPELAECVYEIATEYLRPRVFPHGKHATVAMLAVQALVAMLSKRASEALATVNELPQAHHWFREQLGRRLINLHQRWAGAPEAVRNLSKLMVSVVEK